MEQSVGTGDLPASAAVEIVWCPGADEQVDCTVSTRKNATVGEVLQALGAQTSDATVDGRTVGSSTPVSAAGLRRGSRLSPGDAGRPRGPRRATMTVAVVAGIGAGRVVALQPGTWEVGRAPSCDVVIDAPSVSARHASLHVTDDGHVTITDLGSTNGTWVDGTCIDGPQPVSPAAGIRLGAAHLAVRAPDVGGARLGPRRPDGTQAFNRPPRLPVPAPPTALTLPSARPEAAPRARLPWAALIAPLVLGIGMAALYDPRFAAFALFSPAMMLGTWLEDRRRARRDERDGAQRLDSQLEDLATALEAAAVTEQRRARLLGGDAAAAAAAAAATATRLWERRPSGDDFLAASLGVSAIAWQPRTNPGTNPAPEAEALVARTSRLDDVPVVVQLGPGNVCGFTGPGDVTRAAAANLLLQIAANQGPADVRIAILTDLERLEAWDWTKWLPHTASSQLPAGGRLMAADDATAQAVVAAVRDTVIPTVVIVDGEALLHGRTAAARELLACDHVGAIVCVAEAASLPAACTTVVTCCDDQGVARVSYASGAAVDNVVLACVGADTARDTALALAPLDDPEIVESGAALPQTVSLLSLLALENPSAQVVVGRWGRGAPPVVPLGVGDSGTVMLDLAADGPHGLIAGTTGAGKSELLRSIVAGLAATVSPADLNFVLIDYKGGSAFDACAGLPHTVGVVTDLDESLGRRALRCLEAELCHRERTLRAAGAVDLDAYRARATDDGSPPLPRLLVAVDEFATLAAEMPDFMDRLVSIAQRGRSLGVHLLLATQRPAGAVSDHIRANTNLRIALRVQDPADSTDVVASSVAAHISRRRPGRAYARLGPGELVAFQAASVSGRTSDKADAVDVAAFTAGVAHDDRVGAEPPGDSDLARLVGATRAAFAQTGMAPPRRPWPEPLPLVAPPSSLPAPAQRGAVVIGVADDPDHQRTLPCEVDLVRQSLLLYGELSSGPTAALATIGLATGSVPGFDCYVIDAGSQHLAPLADLPHVGAVVGAGDRLRQERLVRFLADEVSRRRAAAATGTARADPAIVLLLDNYAGFAAVFDDLEGLAVLDLLTRVIADGPALGVTVAVTADRVNALPPATAATIPRRLLFRLPDRHDYAQFGVAPDWGGDLPPNRAVDASTGLQVQLAEPPPSLADAVAAFDGVARPVPPRALLVLPEHVPLAAVVDAAHGDGEEWFVPLGLDDRVVAPAGWHLGAGDHALVTGPARSGKSTVLASIAALVAKTRPGVTVLAAALRRSPLQDNPYVDDVATTPEALDALVRRIRDASTPTVLLVDDADGVDDPAGVLGALLAQRRDDLWCIAAGRADVLRTQYGHWTAEIRRSRCGLALRPNLDLDGDLWHTPLPRRRRDPLPAGRGYLVADGTAELLQAAAS